MVCGNIIHQFVVKRMQSEESNLPACLPAHRTGLWRAPIVGLEHNFAVWMLQWRRSHPVEHLAHKATGQSQGFKATCLEAAVTRYSGFSLGIWVFLSVHWEAGLRLPSPHFYPLHAWLYKRANVHWGLFVAFWILMKGNREKQRCFLALIIYQYLGGLVTLDLSEKTSVWANRARDWMIIFWTVWCEKKWVIWDSKWASQRLSEENRWPWSELLVPQAGGDCLPLNPPLSHAWLWWVFWIAFPCQRLVCF